MSFSPTSTRLTDVNKAFLSQLKTLTRSSESSIINQALDWYRKYKIRQELIAESIENPKQDVKMANSPDFDEYSRLIHEAETI